MSCLSGQGGVRSRPMILTQVLLVVGIVSNLLALPEHSISLCIAEVNPVVGWANGFYVTITKIPIIKDKENKKNEVKSIRY